MHRKSGCAHRTFIRRLAHMILVTGATGTNGRLVVELLLRAGAAVRAMVQSTSKAADLAQAGGSGRRRRLRQT